MYGIEHKRNRVHDERGVAENQLLRRLGAADYARIAGDLEPVQLEFKETLHEPGKRIPYIYFPTGCVASLITLLTDGNDPVETGTVGYEGVVGLPVVLGASCASERALCQIAGSALRMTADRFAAAAERIGMLRRPLLRYANALMVMMSQSVACNRRHDTRPRMARWLLMTHDRVHRDNFPLTQEFLGQMLGVRRPAVSLAGASLQHAGLIRYARGKITIVDRTGLERVTCECYRRIADEFARSFGAR